MMDELGDLFHEIYTEIAFYGNYISLLVVTRFDGNGNSRVFFRIKSRDTNIDYEKYDAAAVAYNFKVKKLSRQ